MQLKRVVVTGIGALTPIGNNAKDFWNALAKGVSGAATITRFDIEKFRTQFACEIKDFNVLDHIDRKESRKMDPFTQYAMIVADEAVHDSGILDTKFIPEDVGVIWASGIGGLQVLEKEISQFTQGDGTPRFNPFFIPKMIGDIAPGYISIKYGFRGPNFGTISACASSNNSIIDSYNYIRLGMAKAIITGGSEACVTPSAVGGFNSMKALSERNDSPSTASRPFDADRDGFVLGEGAASLVLEEYEHAKARGAKIYGEILGGGLTADAHHITAPHPEGLGATNVMKIALKDAEISPSDIDYVNVHGTSTPLGDVSETKAILGVFGDHAYNLNISSTKSMTGHLLGAAGAVEALACLSAINSGIVPPTINHFTDDEQFDSKLNFTFNKAQKREVNYALSNTFGFGGHNASVIMGKCE
ncbi:MAG: beta-ketoacyl-ACP synthase II [Bacteroidia bacterium]|nr:beta-ketoacyl-ACP synthase II [Bacteroidia bacterium]MDG2041856.1 beta-ketoacyl-ACP synthase II [Bacteroidia bacterium]|tara:strand:+ start:991 stop:2241 length:1251 start_codon:yes stop_codon:yes gene_type:complete